MGVLSAEPAIVRSLSKDSEGRFALGSSPTPGDVIDCLGVWRIGFGYDLRYERGSRQSLDPTLNGWLRDTMRGTEDVEGSAGLPLAYNLRFEFGAVFCHTYAYSRIPMYSVGITE